MLVAQISDIHASVDSASLDVLAEAISWLDTLRPDALVITGDLVDDGWRQGYRRIAQSLQSLSCPIHILPGNSDRQDLMRSELGELARWPNSAGPMHFRSVVGDVVLIGLDVTVAGQSHGDALPHLQWLKDSLADGGGAFLIFMHQPPFPIGIEVLDNAGCRNADSFLAVLEAAEKRPSAVLCGHVHRPVFGRLGSIAVQTCGSLCPPNPPLLEGRPDIAAIDAPSFLIHQINDGRLLSHVVSVSTPVQIDRGG